MRAPGKRAALYRDWVVMVLCRPFFRQVIHHWHAVGLGVIGDHLLEELAFERLGRPDPGRREAALVERDTRVEAGAGLGAGARANRQFRRS